MTSTMPPPPSARDRIDLDFPDPWRVAPSTRLLGAVAVGGVAFDLGIRHPLGVISLLAVALTAGAGVAGGWIRGPLARRLNLLTLAPAGMLVWRDSDWLAPLNVAAVVGLLLLAAMVRPEPEPFTRALRRLLHPVSAIEPPARTTDLMSRSTAAAMTGHDLLGRRLLRLLRGVTLAVPVVAVLAALLAAADPLFRSWLRLPIGGSTLVQHAVVIGIGVALTAGLAGHGAWAEIRPPGRARRMVGPTEATVVLGGVAATYAVFVATQVIAIAAGAAYVERTTGLTYAEYARTGFFQLVAAATLTLIVVTLIRRHRRPASPRAAYRLQTLELTIVGLTLVVVGVAIRRLVLYEAEFGLTMLRFSTIVFAGFLGVVFVVTGLSISGALRAHPVPVVAAAALATLLAVNVANPERIVAERNIERFGGTDQLDVDYLVDHLGADAIPAMLTDDAVAERLCRRAPSIDDREIVFNWSRDRAASALADACN